MESLTFQCLILRVGTLATLLQFLVAFDYLLWGAPVGFTNILLLEYVD